MPRVALTARPRRSNAEKPIYGANCAQCHGGDLAGTDRGPSLLEPVYGPDQLSDDEFADAIRNGVDEAALGVRPDAGERRDQ